jgi:hypothetical protein
MTWTIKTRQYLIFGVYLGFALLLALVAYPAIKPGWVAYRTGENFFSTEKFA